MMSEHPDGLYSKFYVQRIDLRDGPGGDRKDARYFVLDYAHDPHARKALAAYRDSCFDTLPELAGDLYRALEETRGGCSGHPMTDAEQDVLPWWDKDDAHRAAWEAEQDRENAKIEQRFRAAGYDPDGFYPSPER